MFDRITRFFGSIKLAIPLLSAIIGILIWATFYESQVGSTTVQQEIYKSPWFGALMFMLAMNLGMSALSRYPWKGARKIGFAITHLGLIVIIAGSAAVIHLGVEGMLLLSTDGGANNQIRVEGDTLEVLAGDDEIQRANIFIKDDGSVNPQFVGDLELEAYSDNAVKVINFVAGDTYNPAATLSLHSDRMGQTLERSLAVAPNGYNKVAIGPAELEIIKAEDSTTLKQLLTEPQANNQHPWGEIIVNYDGESKAFDVKENGSKSLQFKDLELKFIKFFPDFRLDSDNRPISASDNLNNPGVLIEISNSSSLERWFVFGKEDISPIHAVVSGEAISEVDLDYQVEIAQANDYFRVITAEDGKLYYAAKSSKGFKSGEYQVGQSVTPGWADFQITLEAYIPNAKLERDIIVVSDNSNEEGSPALLVKTPSGKETWLPWAEPTVIEDDNEEIYAAFSPKLLQIPFAIKLEDFIVDRNEGSESVAMWTSKIRIEDEANNVIEPRKVWMNHPTWYQGWKIAQASWNPGDLTQSTLQVKREPALVTGLTWLGSVLVVSGIAVIFYAPGLAKKFRSKKKQQNSNSESLSDKEPENKELASTP